MNFFSILRQMKSSFFSERDTINEVVNYAEQSIKDPEYRTAATVILGLGINTTLQLVLDKIREHAGKYEVVIYHDSRSTETPYFYELEYKGDRMDDVTAVLVFPLIDLLENYDVHHDH